MKKAASFISYFLSSALIAVGLAYVLYGNIGPAPFPSWDSGSAQAKVVEIEMGPSLSIAAFAFGEAPYARISFSAQGNQTITVVEPVTKAFLEDKIEQEEFTLRYAYENPEVVKFTGQHTHWVIDRLLWVLTLALTPVIFAVFVLGQYIHAKNNYGNELFD